MGKWDDSADNKHASQTPHLSVFTFHLSLCFGLDKEISLDG